MKYILYTDINEHNSNNFCQVHIALNLISKEYPLSNPCKDIKFEMRVPNVVYTKFMLYV